MLIMAKGVQVGWGGGSGGGRKSEEAHVEELKWDMLHVEQRPNLKTYTLSVIYSSLTQA